RRVRRQEPTGQGHHLPRRRDDRHSLDRRRPLRLRAVLDDCERAHARLGGDREDRFHCGRGTVGAHVPIVVRNTEEILRLVPMDLREASYALGVPKWKTIMKIVLPTSVSGILSGVTIAIARVIGET